MIDPDENETEFNWENESFSQNELLAMQLEPPTYLVEGLIATPGLVILAGRKKIGKSWMALQLAQCVASGKPFLEGKTRRGKVVYLALEDGERRLQQRLRQQEVDRDLPIEYCPRWPAINSTKGLEALRSVTMRQTPALVVIDTLASAKNQRAKENDADIMGEFFNALHQLAIEANTVIVIVAHHGKSQYGDPGFDTRGSSAIPGATDGNIGIYKNTDGTFTLKAEGRDIPNVDLRVSFDTRDSWTWQNLGDDRDIRRIEAESRILKVIEALGNAYAEQIARQLGIAVPTIYTHLKRMRNEGRVVCTEIKTEMGVKTRYTLPQK